MNIKAFFKGNNQKALESRKPIAELTVKTLRPLVYEDQWVQYEVGTNSTLTCYIFANGNNVLHVGEYPDGGGYTDIEVDVLQYTNMLDIVGVKVNLIEPIDVNIESILRNLSNKYNVNFLSYLI